MRIGLFGGSFDPVHVGHVGAARAAIGALSLDRLLFIPSRQPPLKAKLCLADGEQRLQMLALATASEPRMAVSDVEIRRPGPSFTVDTATELRCGYPADAQFFFVLGSDCADRLPRWKGIDALHAMLRFAIVARDGESVAGLDSRLIPVAMPPCPASSTAVRAACAAGLPSEGMLAPAVARYIAEHGLYREPVHG
ncbi:MAG: nicotinate (nicotinamide) nucleotide adenylyltransferase [Sphingomonadaceae bacterium]|nr:nicotinate (nicotinamide) nucleotide adenylyltransferase [Sphingomonadaceae bacterium]